MPERELIQLGFTILVAGQLAQSPGQCSSCLKILTLKRRTMVLDRD